MDYVILAQTDTTVGFLSQNASRLSEIKSRPPHKPFIQSFDSLKSFTQEGGRVPEKFKKDLRRTKNTSFIIKNRAIRIVDSGPHHKLLQKYGWLYSTSANAQGAHYEAHFAHKHADLIVEDARGLFEGAASKIYKINHTKQQQLR